jgi:hypothetical protein
LSNIMSNMFNSHINSLMSKLANVEWCETSSIYQ